MALTHWKKRRKFWLQIRQNKVDWLIENLAKQTGAEIAEFSENQNIDQIVRKNSESDDGMYCLKL